MEAVSVPEARHRKLSRPAVEGLAKRARRARVRTSAPRVSPVSRVHAPVHQVATVHNGEVGDANLFGPYRSVLECG